MAKTPSRDDRGRVKFRVVEFELDGSDASLQDAIRSLASALNNGPKPVPKVVSSNGNENRRLAAPAIEERGLVVGAEEDEGSDPEAAAEPGRRSRAGKPSVSATPEIINDLDLTTGDLPLKKFIEQKSISEEDTKRYLAIARWLKEYRKLDSIGMNHVYTAYRHMGWNIPRNALKPFQNAKTRGWFGKGKARGEYTINHVGEGVVNDLGK